jgi:hypothetical protein
MAVARVAMTLLTLVYLSVFVTLEYCASTLLADVRDSFSAALSVVDFAMHGRCFPALQTMCLGKGVLRLRVRRG